MLLSLFVAFALPSTVRAQPSGGDVWPTTPGSFTRPAPTPAPASQSRSKAEEKGKELGVKLRDDEELARKFIRPGMSVAEVRDLLGEPRGEAKSETVGHFQCLGYGRVWVVFEDGQASCLRSRLEYVDRYESNCHCAGDAMNIIPFAQP
jgi:hypothetical protein